MMTPEEQHLALCEWCGKHPHSMAMIKHWEIAGLKQTPIFELTLDWLHECEERLDTNGQICERNIYAQTLKAIIHPGPHMNLNWLGWCFAHAAKEQRLEALCRTLWPERF